MDEKKSGKGLTCSQRERAGKAQTFHSGPKEVVGGGEGFRLLGKVSGRRVTQSLPMNTEGRRKGWGAADH